MARTFNTTNTSTMTADELAARSQEYDDAASSLLAYAVQADACGNTDKAISLAREHANARHFAKKYAKMARSARKGS